MWPRPRAAEAPGGDRLSGEGLAVPCSHQGGPRRSRGSLGGISSARGPTGIGLVAEGLVEVATREGRLSRTQPSGVTGRGRREEGGEGRGCLAKSLPAHPAVSAFRAGARCLTDPALSHRERAVNRGWTAATKPLLCPPAQWTCTHDSLSGGQRHPLV